MGGQPCKDCTSHAEVMERVVIVEQSTKSAHHRLDDMEKHTESIIRLSMSVEHLTESIAINVLPNQEKHDNRIIALENRPGVIALKWWSAIVLVAVTAVVTGVIMYGLGVLLPQEDEPVQEEVELVWLEQDQ